MSRIGRRFQDRRGEGRRVLVSYITAGDPNAGATVPLLHELVSAGADILEIGVPFSDPMADGPVIQAACERALANKIGLRDVLEMTAEFRRSDDGTPVILMGYLNPIERMGYEAFANAAAAAGVDGVLTVDLPPEEARDLAASLKRAGLCPIFLVAPTSDDTRLERIASLADGFVYYVSFKGVTGANRLDVPAVAQRLAMVRKHISLPVGVGFGIRDAQTAAQVAKIADAVVVGSALVQKIAELRDDPKRMTQSITGLLSEIRRSMDDAVAVAPQSSSPERAGLGES